VCGGLELAAEMDEPLDAVLVDSQSDEQRVERSNDDERFSDRAAIRQRKSLFDSMRICAAAARCRLMSSPGFRFGVSADVRRPRIASRTLLSGLRLARDLQSIER
jgi:hypothetical protein